MYYEKNHNVLVISPHYEKNHTVLRAVSYCTPTARVLHNALHRANRTPGIPSSTTAALSNSSAKQHALLREANADIVIFFRQMFRLTYDTPKGL